MCGDAQMNRSVEAAAQIADADLCFRDANYECRFGHEEGVTTCKRLEN